MRDTPKSRMATFDRLPRELRLKLQNTVENYPASAVAAAHKRKGRAWAAKAIDFWEATLSGTGRK